MTKEAIIRTSVLLGFILSLLSSLIAFLTGGDLFFIVLERFFLVLIVGATLTWITLTTINLVVIGAARKSIDELRKSLDKQNSRSQKGENIDLVSAQTEIEGAVDDFKVDEEPEIKELTARFEPFRPRKIETDKE